MAIKLKVMRYLSAACVENMMVVSPAGVVTQNEYSEEKELDAGAELGQDIVAQLPDTTVWKYNPMSGPHDRMLLTVEVIVQTCDERFIELQAQRLALDTAGSKQWTVGYHAGISEGKRLALEALAGLIEAAK